MTFDQAIKHLPVDGFFSKEHNTYWWERIEIPSGQRKKGKALKAMREFVKLADKFGVTVSCFAVPDEGTNSEFAVKWVALVRSVGFEVDIERLKAYTGMTKKEILANDKICEYGRDELIRFPKKG